MTILHTIGEYRITSEKVDSCLPGWAGICEVFGIVVLVASIFLALYFASIGNGVHFILMVTSFILGCSMLFLPRRFKNCGVEITLEVPDRTAEVQYETTYQFTKDPEKDALKIQEIINSHIQTANHRTKNKKAEQKAEDEKKQECCTRYQEVMHKVK
jgi:hypothetical protein